jgi:large subunit ribosomal protein L9
MELILKENVHGLGYKDEIVTVKDGYGRNYLIPTGKAVIASASAKKMLAEELKQRAHKLEKIKNDALALAEKLGAVEGIKIATKVSATGGIYGSVNSLHVSEALAKLGFEIDRKTITVKDVKEVGSYTATIKLHKEVSVEVPFEVVAEEA